MRYCCQQHAKPGSSVERLCCGSLGPILQARLWYLQQFCAAIILSFEDPRVSIHIAKLCNEERNICNLADCYLQHRKLGGHMQCREGPGRASCVQQEWHLPIGQPSETLSLTQSLTVKENSPLTPGGKFSRSIS